MENARVEQLLDFDGVHVLVIGDVMLDEYIYGKADRISPEAPVPVVSLKSRDHKLGGAANVAMNTSSLGAKTTLVGLIGDDGYGKTLTSLTKKSENLSSYFIKDVGRKTTCKTRILAANQHLLRVDNEDWHDVDAEIVGKVEKMMKFIHHNQAIDIIILQDYNKGFFSAKMIAMVMEWSRENKVKTALDPKTRNIKLFKGVDIFKPNLKELRNFVGYEVKVSDEDLSKAGNLVLDQLKSDLIVLTLSSDGIYVKNEEEQHWESASVQSIVDVSGAGDTVISLVSLLYCQGDASLSEIASVANYGGAAVCKEPGVTVVNKKMVLDAMKSVI